jgi:hypothetical protein
MYSAKQNEYYRERRRLNPEPHRAYNRKSYAKNREGRLTHTKAYHNEVKRQVMHHYSSGSMACKCCGVTGLPFLSIDHIDGGGRKHRENIGIGTGIRFYFWLRREKYPPGFQVLCHNCNQGKRAHGRCPHTDELLK